MLFPSHEPQQKRTATTNDDDVVLLLVRVGIDVVWPLVSLARLDGPSARAPRAK
jgi:hypothetical protein